MRLALVLIFVQESMVVGKPEMLLSRTIDFSGLLVCELYSGVVLLRYPPSWRFSFSPKAIRGIAFDIYNCLLKLYFFL